MHAKNCFQSTARSHRQGKLPEHASKHGPSTVLKYLSAALHRVRAHSSEKFTLLKVSPNFFEKNKQIPTTTAKPSLNVLNSYLNPQTIWAFLCISRELSFPQQHCDGWPCICVSPDGRSSTFKEGHAFSPFVLGLEKLGGRNQASQIMREGLVHCPATSGSAQLKDKTVT